MTLSDVAIKRPVFTTMMALAIVVLGLVGYLRLGTDLYPSTSFPFVVVNTVYPGAGPRDLEDDVTRPIEDAVAGISGVERISSYSREDVSSVLVQFKMKTPQAEAVQQVRDKVGLAMASLPTGARPPLISPVDLAAEPVLVFSVSAPTRNPTSLRELLEDQVRSQLEQLDGVAAVNVLGGGETEIAVDLFRDRLLMLGLTPDAVFQKIHAEHLDLPAGRYFSGTGEVGIRVRGQFQSVDELRNLVVASAADGSQVRLGDVALVRAGAKEPRTMVRTNGADSVAIEVIKQAGANSVSVAKSAQALLPSLQKRFELQTHVLIDQSVVIQANAHEVWVAIFFGGAMAILVILLFLLDGRGTAISALALPTSVVGTLFGMYVLGYSLNQLTLLGLSLAIGLLIDDAVVVRESITRRLEHGDSPAHAASRGTRDIALAVLATTLSLCAVFIPVAFMEGMVGQFFREFGLTITVAVLLSLFVAFTLDPMLSARLSRARKPSEARDGNGIGPRLRRAFDRLDHLYGRTLDWVLAHRKSTVSVVLGLVCVSIAVGAKLGKDFLTSEDRGQLIVNLEFPAGTNLATTAERSAQAEAEVLRLPGVTTVYSVVGPQEDVRKARWRIKLVDKGQRQTKLDYYKVRIREILSHVPQATSVVSDPPTIEAVGDYPPIFMHIVGRDFTTLRKEAEYVASQLRAIPGTADVQLRDSPRKPELQVVVNRDMAARQGIPAGAIALQVRLAGQGDVAARMRQGRRSTDIRVRLAAEDRDSPSSLQQIWIYTPRGPVALSQVASLVPGEGPAVIEHEQRERQIAVSAQLAPGAALGEVTSALRHRLGQHPLPEGYQYVWRGLQKEMADMMQAMGLALGLALVFIYMVLASQFESFIHPLTIMLSLPLALVGAVLALWLTGRSLNMGSYIGVILLMGLVTKNAILLVDGALARIRAGDSPLAAIRQAGPRRLRPILMTSAAMILGMLPTALGQGIGSEFRSPMAIAVIGGVTTSTILTLWVVPVVFLWVERVRRSARASSSALAAAAIAAQERLTAAQERLTAKPGTQAQPEPGDAGFGIQPEPAAGK